MQIKNELRHDKTNNVAVCPAKTQISLGICPVISRLIRVFTRRTLILLVLSMETQMYCFKSFAVHIFHLIINDQQFRASKASEKKISIFNLTLKMEQINLPQPKPKSWNDLTPPPPSPPPRLSWYLKFPWPFCKIPWLFTDLDFFFSNFPDFSRLLATLNYYSHFKGCLNFLDFLVPVFFIFLLPMRIWSPIISGIPGLAVTTSIPTVPISVSVPIPSVTRWLWNLLLH